MMISDVLARKGSGTVTVAPAATVPELLAVLAEHRIGAAVVTQDGDTVAGIVSERDVVRRMHAVGADLLAQTVGDLMTSQVHACAPGDAVDAVLGVMTERRVRHLPVLADGALVGLVSIGDLVKHRIDELQVERDQLTAYISG